MAVQPKMKIFKRSSVDDRRRPVAARCNHPLAVIVDPTERELKELETMLARCPNCSQWHPGQGPIMAVLTSHRDPSQNSSNHYML
jgi:hypothetical protein